MLIREWVQEGMYEDDSEGTIKHIRLRAWEFFRKEIEGSFILRLLGVVGKVRNIFTEIFGEEIHA